MADEQDVSAASSPAPDSPVPDPAPSAAGVDEQIGDRPARNILSEVDRKWAPKFDALAQQQAEILQFLRSQQTPKPQVSGGIEDYTDQQLLELAQAGHVQAQMVLNQRQTQRTVQQAIQQSQRVSIAVQQRNALYAKYPVFQDPSHPLTQYAMRAKALLVQGGADPNDAATDVDAMKTAIADHADNREMFSKPDQEPQRRTAVTNATTIDGATQRRVPSNTKQAPPVSAEEWRLAKRYGVKDPVKAKQNFDKRQQARRDGTEMYSALGSVAAFIREE